MRVVDDEEYEKNEVFYVELGEPIVVKTVSGNCHFHVVLKYLHKINVIMSTYVFYILIYRQRYLFPKSCPQ